MAWFRGKLALVLLILQAVFLILFGVLVEYDPEADARKPQEGNSIDLFYPMFQDVHVMIFIGFAFLMTFLRRYSWGSAAFNFLIAAFILEWATLMRGFLELHNGMIRINIHTMLTADFTAAAVLISFGAVLGKVSALQLVILGFIEVIFAAVNEYIVFAIFGAVDVGGSMVVHAFGAYFGLTVSRVLAKEVTREHPKESTSYNSDLFSLLGIESLGNRNDVVRLSREKHWMKRLRTIQPHGLNIQEGTLFLWMFWPSFNSALAFGDARHRAVLNTYYSLVACTVVTFAFSSLMNKNGKFQMEHIQNATLAGGVAVGTTADLMIFPWGAVLIGSVAGFISTFGFVYITPWLSTKLKIHDTCGVNNLHGMPAIVAGLGGAVAAGLADMKLYGDNLYTIFGAREPDNGDSLATNSPAEARSASGQAGYQLAALVITLAMAIVGGLITGFILKLPFWNEPEDDELYEDIQHWEGAVDEEASAGMINGSSSIQKTPIQMENDNV